MGRLANAVQSGGLRPRCRPAGGDLSSLGPGDNGRLERFIIALNFSDRLQVVDIPFADNGRWRDLLNDHEVEVSDFRLARQQLEPYWGRVYYQ